MKMITFDVGNVAGIGTIVYDTEKLCMKETYIIRTFVLELFIPTFKDVLLNLSQRKY